MPASPLTSRVTLVKPLHLSVAVFLDVNWWQQGSLNHGVVVDVNDTVQKALRSVPGPS